MFNVIVARSVVSGIKTLEKPIHWVKTLTDVMVKEKQENKRKPIRLDLFVDEEQLERILQHPDVLTGLGEATLLKKSGSLPQCDKCGALHSM